MKLGVAFLPRSVVMGLVQLFPWGLLYFKSVYFLSLMPLWLTIWFSGAALLGSLLIKNPLSPYRGPGLDGDGQDAE